MHGASQVAPTHRSGMLSAQLAWLPDRQRQAGVLWTCWQSRHSAVHTAGRHKVDQEQRTRLEIGAGRLLLWPQVLAWTHLRMPSWRISMLCMSQGMTRLRCMQRMGNLHDRSDHALACWPCMIHTRQGVLLCTSTLAPIFEDVTAVRLDAESCLLDIA